MALIWTAVMFGITVGVLSFLTRRWRREELERRRRRALLASGARQEEEDEDGNPVKPKTEEDKPEPVVLAFSEEEGAELAATLDRLMKEMFAAIDTYHKSFKAADSTASSLDTALFNNNKIEDFPESAVSFQMVVERRLELQREVIAFQKELERKLGEIGNTKAANAALAALQQELKRLTPLRVSQLPARLAAVRMVANGAAVAGENMVKNYGTNEQETRKTAAKLKARSLTVSRVPDSEKSEALFKRLADAYTEFRKQLKTLVDAGYRCSSAASDASYKPADTALRSSPSVATMDELERVLAAAESRRADHMAGQAGIREAGKAVPALIPPFDAALLALKAVIAQIDKSEDPRPEKIIVARKLITDWHKSIDEKSTEARTTAVGYIKNDEVIVGTLVIPDTEPVKAIMLRCTALVLRFPSVLRKCTDDAYEHKRLAEQTSFKRPEKPNDAGVAALADDLLNWAAKMAARCGDYFASRQSVKDAVMGLTRECTELKAEMQPLLRDINRYEPKSFCQATALQLLAGWLDSKLGEQLAEVGKHVNAAVRKRPEVLTRDADAEQVSALKAAMRSLSFALAQAQIAEAKRSEISGRRLSGEPSMPAFVPSDGAEFDFEAVLGRIEAHHNDCADKREQRRAHEVELRNATDAKTAREGKTTERRAALNALAQTTRAALSDESGDELYLNCLMAEKYVTLFV